MNRTTIATRARASAAAFLATTVIASTSLATGSARAQDPSGTAAPVQIETQPAAGGPAEQQYVAQPREDGPRIITDWREGEPIPHGYHPVQRIRRGAVIGGAVTFGVLYMLTALIASVWTDVANASHTHNSGTALFIPVFGPFITIAQSSTATGDFFLVLDGAGQAAGAAFLIWGLTAPQTLLMKDGYSQPYVTPHPMLLGKGGAGFGLTGSF